MDIQFEMEWRAVENRISQQFGEDIDLQGILYIIGVQELGQGFRKFKKDEKVNLMHVAICTLLEPYGYYEFQGNDKDNWPHFQRNQKLPNLEASEQELLIKRAIIAYFKSMDELEVETTNLN
ncbi:MAG: hypothetical protein P8H59_09760 [Flavobacteriales bacterium]|nr:hypothetical protein [Flavobacteriales bacterium]MDG1781226.1 hypothetical protein [Flavobacteriales bacterium]MDG2245950.1 hypothetical protein [Flavobacteriales bacterium]